jgi:transglutaminase-like putative cysteine protease
MEKSLEQTFYCNHGHPEIQAVAAGLKSGESDPAAIAKRTFYFVRDRFPFGFDLYQRKASEILKNGYGVCWNKSLLLTALLRCNGIPAQFGSIPLKRSFVRPAVGAWHRLANHPYHHCLVHAWLNDRWTILDAVLDPKTYETFFRPLGVKWGIDWNGNEDVRLYTESVLGPAVVHDDIDAALDNKAGNKELPKFMAHLGNWNINRQMWKKTGGPKAIESALGDYAGLEVTP